MWYTEKGWWRIRSAMRREVCGFRRKITPGWASEGGAEKVFPWRELLSTGLPTKGTSNRPLKPSRRNHSSTPFGDQNEPALFQQKPVSREQLHLIGLATGHNSFPWKTKSRFASLWSGALKPAAIKTQLTASNAILLESLWFSTPRKHLCDSWWRPAWQTIQRAAFAPQSVRSCGPRHASPPVAGMPGWTAHFD